MSIRKLNTKSCLDEVTDQYNRNKSSYVNQEYLELMEHETRKEKACINYHWYNMVKEIDQINIETRLLILEAFTFGYIFEKYNNLDEYTEKMIIEKIQNYISFRVAEKIYYHLKIYLLAETCDYTGGSVAGSRESERVLCNISNNIIEAMQLSNFGIISCQKIKNNNL